MSSSTTEQLLRVRRSGFTMIAGITNPYLQSEDEVVRVAAELQSLIEGKQYPKLVLTFDGVRFVSSSMLGHLVKLHRTIAKAKGKFRVCSLTPALRDIVKASQLDKILDVYGSENEAIAGL
ncbi:STAS domain-containing protein [Singulisphaera sp. PoT]|uniref:STAS domain-containing protein n=1 Tax=Singulisphaera sp. PoT TaxID=3411797 RepID=UPI003BF5A534